jgi:hypothetical protein
MSEPYEEANLEPIVFDWLFLRFWLFPAQDSGSAAFKSGAQQPQFRL